MKSNDKMKWILKDSVAVLGFVFSTFLFGTSVFLFFMGFLLASWCFSICDVQFATSGSYFCIFQLFVVLFVVAFGKFIVRDFGL